MLIPPETYDEKQYIGSQATSTHLDPRQQYVSLTNENNLINFKNNYQQQKQQQQLLLLQSHQSSEELSSSSLEKSLGIVKDMVGSEPKQRSNHQENLTKKMLEHLTNNKINKNLDNDNKNNSNNNNNKNVDDNDLNPNDDDDDGYVVDLKMNCDKLPATPSLLQEMNLARRACWCNNNNDQDDNDKNDNDESDIQMKQLQKVEEENNKSFNLNTNNKDQDINDNVKDDHFEMITHDNHCANNNNYNNNYDVYNDDDHLDNLTKVLNGATNSSSINKLKIKTKINSDIKTTTNYLTNLKLNQNIQLINKLDVDEPFYKKSNKNLQSETTTLATKENTFEETTSPLIRQKLDSTASTNVHTSDKDQNSKASNESSDARKSDSSDDSHSNSSWKMKLFNFWMAFVAFCDSITIKSDDPRFAEYRRQDEEEKQKRREAQKDAKTKSFKIITSKKFIFLVIVTILFSRLNRIEARPNMSLSQNAIGGQPQESDTSNMISSEMPAAMLQSSNIINPKLSVPLDGASSAKPPASNEIPDVHPNDGQKTNDHFKELPNLGHARADDILGDHEGHAHDRYPLSQVDFERVKTPFIIGIWILSASIAKIGFHMTPKLHLIFPESCLLIVVGVVIGVVLYFCTDVAVSPLTPETFFFYMLPPIILDAGYFMPNRLFFDNLGTILLMAVVGTIFNIATIGGSLYACGLTGIFGADATPRLLDTFLFASLISAVDPVAVLAVFEEIHVNEILYIVVFGESLLNDAVTVVMYHMMEVYNEIGISNIIAQDVASGVGSFFVVAIGGTVIGIIWGFLTGLVTRFTDHVRVIEPIFIFVMAYLAYLNAEIFHMSGILSITFCGITMKNYVESNISQKSHTTVKYALKMLSSSSETIIFMFLGVATVNNNHAWNTWFVILTIFFCSTFRPIGVIILTAMANRFRLHKLSRVDQFVMSYGGLRGAVAFALVLLIDERIVQQKNMFVTTTIAVIYFTVFVQGITIKPLVQILNVKRANKRKPTMNERIHERFMDHLMAGIEDIVGKTGNYNVRDKFKRFDNRFIRPLLLRDLKGAEPKIIETYSKLTMRDAIEVMRRNPSTIGQMTGTESMSALFRTYTNNCIGGSPSLTNLDNTCSRNLDMHELDYNPSKKDLTDAKIHHLLAEELKPYRRHRRLSYSRHAVDDRDLSTQVNYKMQMNFRRMFNDRKHHKRSKRGQKEGVKTNHVSFHDFQQNGTTKQFTHEESVPKPVEAPANDDWEEGLTFTAKSSLAENPIPEEDRNLSRDSDGERRVATPTATESTLPWKRQGDEVSDAIQQNEFPAWASNKEYLAYNSPSATFLGGINKPKQPKSVIGLFRRESSSSKGGGSLTGVDSQVDAVSVRGSDPALAAVLSQMIVPPPGVGHNPRLDKRSQSVSAGSGPSISIEGHSGPFPVTASHRRNVRRGSMLELSGDTIPEETYYHGHSKSLCEPTGDEWETTPLQASSDHTASGNSDKLLRSSGREPLLPKLTPRAQIRRGMSASAATSYGGSGNMLRNPVTTALLSNNSDYDDDEEEDFDLYDDENIVVTTTTTNDSTSGGLSVGSNPLDRHRTQSGASSTSGTGTTATGTSTSGIAGSNPQVTTTIRLTHKNDESII